MKKPIIIAFVVLFLLPRVASAQQVDYSVPYVSQENGNEFVKISKESDYVCLPPVKRSKNGCLLYTSDAADE